MKPYFPINKITLKFYDFRDFREIQLIHLYPKQKRYFQSYFQSKQLKCCLEIRVGPNNLNYLVFEQLRPNNTIQYLVFIHFQKPNNSVFSIRKIWYLVHIHYSVQFCLGRADRPSNSSTKSRSVNLMVSSTHLSSPWRACSMA